MRKELGEWELVEELTGFMAYCCAERKNMEATVAGKLMAVNLYHEQWRGLSLPLQHFRIQAVKKGVRRAYAEAGNQARVRRPLTWEMTRVMEESIGAWGVGGRIVWIGLALTYQLLLRASELFAEEGGKVHEVYCLRRGDVAFFDKGVQLGPGRREAADRVEIRFREGKGDQGKKGAVAVITQGSGGVGEGPEGNVVNLMVKLVGYYRKTVPGGENAPLMTYRSGGRWRVWTKGQATFCLRSRLERVGRKGREQGRGAVGELVAEEFALHSGRIGERQGWRRWEHNRG